MRNLQTKIESLVPHDKVLHYILGNIIQTIIIVISFGVIGLWSVLLGLVTNFSVQWSKEYFIDRKKESGFSWLDIIFGMTGCVPLSIIVFVLYTMLD